MEIFLSLITPVRNRVDARMLRLNASQNTAFCAMVKAINIAITMIGVENIRLKDPRSMTITQGHKFLMTCDAIREKYKNLQCIHNLHKLLSLIEEIKYPRSIHQERQRQNQRRQRQNTIAQQAMTRQYTATQLLTLQGLLRQLQQRLVQQSEAQLWSRHEQTSQQFDRLIRKADQLDPSNQTRRFIKQAQQAKIRFLQKVQALDDVYAPRD
jgi:hypothetical protein